MTTDTTRLGVDFNKWPTEIQALASNYVNTGFAMLDKDTENKTTRKQQKKASDALLQRVIDALYQEAPDEMFSFDKPHQLMEDFMTYVSAMAEMRHLTREGERLAHLESQT